MATDFSQINALDPNSLSGLRRVSKDGSPAATKEAAKQFEALLLQQVLKSMRDATPKGGMFDSDESRMYQSLLDQQLAMQSVCNTVQSRDGLCARPASCMFTLMTSPSSRHFK